MQRVIRANITLRFGNSFFRNENDERSIYYTTLYQISFSAGVLLIFKYINVCLIILKSRKSCISRPYAPKMNVSSYIFLKRKVSL